MALSLVFRRHVHRKVCVVAPASFLREMYVALKKLDSNEVQMINKKVEKSFFSHDPDDPMFDPALVMHSEAIMEVCILESSINNGMFFVQHMHTITRRACHKV